MQSYDYLKKKLKPKFNGMHVYLSLMLHKAYSCSGYVQEDILAIAIPCKNLMNQHDARVLLDTVIWGIPIVICNYGLYSSTPDISVMSRISAQYIAIPTTVATPKLCEL